MTEIITQAIKLALAGVSDKRFADQISSVLDYSEFVKRIFSRYPHCILALIESGDLQTKYGTNYLRAKVFKLAEQINDLQQLDGLLRQVRHIEMVRIAWRELVGVATIEESMYDLSSLADSLVEAALAQHLQKLTQRFGQPMSESSGKKADFVVFAMGKLGGGELNFSSDIDLVFAYSDTGYSDGEVSISNNEFFIKLAQALINSLSNSTVDGFVYRVDMRLRPNGQSGPLVMSFSAMENYYQIHGREWERYAWIKARIIAGNKDQGQAFLSQLRPFIYRKYLDYQAYESLEEMKEMINKEIRQQGMQANIKLGKGGIREIEFIAQSHQLVRGGREPKLRTRSLGQALSTLASLNQIDSQIANKLYQAYLFLRTVEHRLQMRADQQTHHLPGQLDELSEIARSLDLQIDEFEQKLSRSRGFVHNEFNKLHRDKREDNVDDEWQLLWQRVVTDSQLTSSGQTVELIDLLKAYAHSKPYRALESKARQVLGRLIPKILRTVTQSELAAQTLNRVLNVISAIGGRTAYLVLLDQFPVACKQLVELCGSSAWISTWIAEHPIVLDTLINPRTDQYIFNNDEVNQQISNRINLESDAELKHDILRQIHHSSILQIAIADLQHQYKATEIREFISGTAEIIINQVISLCQQELQAKFGMPVSNKTTDYFGVIAYGKLGSKELSYNADLDLVFIYDDEVLQEQTSGGKKSVRIDYYFSRLVQRIITMLNMQTSTGKLYDVDTRLRPSGQSGLLVSSLTQYRKYQTEQAWTWEHQALVKSRMVSNGSSLKLKFEQIRTKILTRSRSDNELRTDIVSMRDKMRAATDLKADFKIKTDFGGMVDIEFVCQYLVLANAADYQDLCAQRSVVGILATVEENKIIDNVDVRLLTETYMQLLELENRYKLHHQKIDYDSKDLMTQMKKVQECWDRMFT